MAVEGHILYMLSDEGLAAEVKKRYRATTAGVVATYPAGLGLLRSLRPEPTAVVLEDGLALDHSQGDPLGAVHEVRGWSNDITVVVVTENPDLQMREADAVVTIHHDRLAEAADAIAQALGLEARVTKRAKAVGFVSDKGGEGKSSLCMGTMLALQEVLRKQAQKHRTAQPLLCTVDLDLSDGNQEILADGLPEEQISDIDLMLHPADEEQEVNVEWIKRNIVHSRLGLDAVLAPCELGTLTALKKEEFLRLRARLLEWYDVLAFDHNSQMESLINATSLGMCDRIIIVMTPTRYGTRGTQRLLPRLTSLLHIGNVRLVVNQALPEDRNKKFVRELEETFALQEGSVLGMIPGGTDEMRAFRNAQKAGLPVPMKGPIWNEFLAIAEKLARDLELLK